MYGVMTLYTHRDSNIRKTWLFMAGFFLLIIGVGWLFAQAYQDSSILYIAVFFSLFMNVLSYWFSDKIVIMLTRAKPAAKENFPELHRIVENLCITAGLPMPKIYYVDEAAPNAFATGRDPKHAVVAVTRGILERLDRSELEGVLAHELSHIGNRDMLVSTVAVVLAGFIAMLSDIFMRMVWWGGGRRRDNQGGHPIIFILAIAAAVLAPIAAMLMQLAISRKREFLADASGALLTRYPEGLARALEKIGADKMPMARAAHDSTAHLWIANPFKGRLGGLHKLFMTHPPIEERVKALRGM